MVCLGGGGELGITQRRNSVVRDCRSALSGTEQWCGFARLKRQSNTTGLMLWERAGGGESVVGEGGRVGGELLS